MQLLEQQTEFGPIPVLALESGQQLTTRVRGYVGNSITNGATGRGRTIAWKLNVAERVRESRGSLWNPQHLYAITLGYSFHLQSHGNRYLDIENFLKPTLDAVAAGLFCEDATDLSTLARWDYDDSNFAHLLAHRLPWAPSADEEGALIFISAVRAATRTPTPPA